MGCNKSQPVPISTQVTVKKPVLSDSQIDKVSCIPLPKVLTMSKFEIIEIKASKIQGKFTIEPSKDLISVLPQAKPQLNLDKFEWHQGKKKFKKNTENLLVSEQYIPKITLDLPSKFCYSAQPNISDSRAQDSQINILPQPKPNLYLETFSFRVPRKKLKKSRNSFTILKPVLVNESFHSFSNVKSLEIENNAQASSDIDLIINPQPKPDLSVEVHNWQIKKTELIETSDCFTIKKPVLAYEHFSWGMQPKKLGNFVDNFTYLKPSLNFETFSWCMGKKEFEEYTEHLTIPKPELSFEKFSWEFSKKIFDIEEEHLTIEKPNLSIENFSWQIDKKNFDIEESHLTIEKPNLSIENFSWQMNRKELEDFNNQLTIFKPELSFYNFSWDMSKKEFEINDYLEYADLSIQPQPKPELNLQTIDVVSIPEVKITLTFCNIYVDHLWPLPKPILQDEQNYIEILAKVKRDQETLTKLSGNFEAKGNRYLSLCKSKCKRKLGRCLKSKKHKLQYSPDNLIKHFEEYHNYLIKCKLCEKEFSGPFWMCQICHIPICPDCKPLDFSCPSSHIYETISTIHKFKCTKCSKTRAGVSRYCQFCNIELCRKCGNLELPNIISCPNNHRYHYEKTDALCSNCNTTESKVRYFCGCSFLCKACFNYLSSPSYSHPALLCYKGHVLHIFKDEDKFCSLCKENKNIGGECQDCSVTICANCAVKVVEGINNIEIVCENQHRMLWYYDWPIREYVDEYACSGACARTFNNIGAFACIECGIAKCISDL